MKRSLTSSDDSPRPGSSVRSALPDPGASPHRPGRPRTSLLTALLVWFATLLAAAPASRSAVDQVVVVFKTHFDLGYTDMASNVVQRYRTTMIDQALTVVDRYRSLPADRQFVWTLSGWPLTRITAPWPGHDPDRRRRVQEAFRNGRFVAHALPFTTHTETLEPEDLVRGLEFSSSLARDAQLPLPRDAKMTDVPCHAWILPTVLVRAGVDFLHLGCNAASRSPQVPALFLWEGPDGSRLPTMYTAENYGTGLVPPADWPYRTWLALIHTGDNHGPPTPEEVAALMAEAATKLPGVKVRVGRLSDFGDALRAEQAQLPVVRGDMPDTWIHGPLCDPDGARNARNTRPRLESIEILGTLLRLSSAVAPDPTAALAEAREQSLLYGEHTWGGALWWLEPGADGQRLPHGPAWRDARARGRFARSEASWAEHSAYSAKATDLARTAENRQTTALADAVAVEGPRTVVFNPLPWSRTAEVVIRGLDPRFRSATPVGSRHSLPLVHRQPGEARFVASSLPPMGHQTFVLGTGTRPQGHHAHRGPRQRPRESPVPARVRSRAPGPAVLVGQTRPPRTRRRRCSLRLRPVPPRTFLRRRRGTVRQSLRENLRRLGHQRTRQTQSAECHRSPLPSHRARPGHAPLRNRRDLHHRDPR